MNSLTRRQFLTGMTAGAVMSPWPRQLCAAGAPARKPNILVIITDQQHARMLGCAGEKHVRTPDLDRLAAGGIRFERAYCSNPVCVPSRISLMTGQYASRFGIERNEEALPKNHPAPPTARALHESLGQVLRRADYRTWYGGKTHWLPGMTPASIGFDTFVRDGRDGLARDAAAFIGQKHAQPFAMVASFINPHDICFYSIDAYTDATGKERIYPQMCDAREGLAQSLRARGAKSPADFADQCPPLPANFEPPDLEATCLRAMSPNSPSGHARHKFNEADWRNYRYAYRRLTEMVDAQIGVVLDALDKSGQADNTLVVFTSDHGDMDGAHRLSGKTYLYEEAVGVPLILRLPGRIQADQADKTHLANAGLDLLPTLCDYAGVAAPRGLPGRSLRPLAENAARERRPSLVVETSGGRMLTTGRYKYCVYAGAAANVRETFVDLEADPGEMRNLIREPSQQPEIELHRNLLARHVKETGDRFAASYLVNP